MRSTFKAETNDAVYYVLFCTQFTAQIFDFQKTRRLKTV
jgi:hypothetical protein